MEAGSRAPQVATSPLHRCLPSDALWQNGEPGKAHHLPEFSQAVQAPSHFRIQRLSQCILELSDVRRQVSQSSRLYEDVAQMQFEE